MEFFDSFLYESQIDEQVEEQDIFNTLLCLSEMVEVEI